MISEDILKESVTEQGLAAAVEQTAVGKRQVAGGSTFVAKAVC